MRYRVTWEIDAEGDTPEAAARWAWGIMRGEESTANVFVIFDEDGEPHRIDLTELDEADA